MYKSKPITILRTFSKRDLRKFDDFIASPFFNKDKEGKLLQLYAILKANHPIYTPTNVDRNKVFQVLFPTYTIEKEEQKLRYLMSALNKVLEAFLVHEECYDTSFEPNFLLLKAYEKRGLNLYFNRTLDISETKLKQNKKRNITYLWQSYLLAANKHTFEAAKDKRKMPNYQEVLQKLDTFYFTSKLQICCDLYNDSTVVQLKKNKKELPLLLNEIMDYVATQQDLPPPLQIYYHILMTLTAELPEPHYKALLHYVNVYEKQFEKQELQAMYVFALNYVIRQAKIDRKYFEQLFNLYQILLEKGLLPPENSALSQYDYKNIIQLSLSLGKIDFAEAFIHDYAPYLDEMVRDNAKNYNLACLVYKKKNFSKAMELLQTVEFTDAYYHADTKVLLFKTYYELNELLLLYNQIQTFKTYINRNKQISSPNKLVYNNFCKYISKLGQLKSKGYAAKNAIEKLRANIESNLQGTKNLNWFFEKLNELQKNRNYS